MADQRESPRRCQYAARDGLTPHRVAPPAGEARGSEDHKERDAKGGNAWLLGHLHPTAESAEKGRYYVYCHLQSCTRPPCGSGFRGGDSETTLAAQSDHSNQPGCQWQARLCTPNVQQLRKHLDKSKPRFPRSANANSRQPTRPNHWPQGKRE